MRHERDYNAKGLVDFCAAATELIPMITNGTSQEVMDAIAKLYKIARTEFPSGPRSVSDALNGLCRELDLPTVITARNKDTGAIL
jgi:hypothetical protein